VPPIRRIGRVWAKDFDLDMVAESIDGSYCFGECKWSSQPIDPGLGYLLKERAKQSGLNIENAHYLLFSSDSFKSKSKPSKEVKQITLQHLLD
jgi:hypothetical protein